MKLKLKEYHKLASYNPKIESLEDYINKAVRNKEENDEILRYNLKVIDNRYYIGLGFMWLVMIVMIILI